MYQHVENPHSSVNQYFPNGQCMAAQNHACVQDPFQVQNRQMDLNVTEYEKYLKQSSKGELCTRSENT